MNATNQNKLHQIQAEATALIVEQLKEFEEGGERPQWLQPWDEHGALTWPVNLEGRPYSGINVVQLLALQKKFGFPSSTWGTYKAYADKGAQVQKGERSARVFFYKSLVIPEKDEQGQVIEDDEGNPKSLTIPMLKQYPVFNLAQTDLEVSPVSKPSVDFLGLQEVFTEAKIDIRHGTDKAYYDRKGDFIRMPQPDQFKTEGAYWAALAHEVIHWTGAPHWLNRTKGAIFGDEAYALEELVAELGSVMLLAQFGLHSEFQSAAYLASWIKSLEGDHRLIFKVAAQAQAAVNFLLSAGGAL